MCYQVRICARRTARAERRQVLVIEMGQRRLALSRVDQKAREHRVEIDAVERDSMPRERFDLILQIVTRFGWALGAEQGRGARDTVMLDDDSLLGARNLQRIPAGLRCGEINCDSGRAGKSLERLCEIVP